MKRQNINSFLTGLVLIGFFSLFTFFGLSVSADTSVFPDTSVQQTDAFGNPMNNKFNDNTPYVDVSGLNTGNLNNVQVSVGGQTLPTVSYGATGNTLGELLIGTINTLGGLMAGLIITLSLIYFILNTIKYIKSQDKDRVKYREGMIYGVVGLAVVVSVWGIVALIRSIFGIEAGGDSITSSIRSLWQ